MHKIKMITQTPDAKSNSPYRDYIRDCDIQALKKEEVINHGSTINVAYRHLLAVSKGVGSGV